VSGRTYNTSVDWITEAKTRPVVDIGQIPPKTRAKLDRMAKRGELEKWQDYWYPGIRCGWGIGPLKTWWGPK
jgi:hypothetical protein